MEADRNSSAISGPDSLSEVVDVEADPGMPYVAVVAGGTKVAWERDSDGFPGYYSDWDLGGIGQSHVPFANMLMTAEASSSPCIRSRHEQFQAV